MMRKYAEIGGVGFISKVKEWRRSMDILFDGLLFFFVFVFV